MALELQRTFSMLTNACCAAATMSVWVAIDSYATQGLAYGGPVVVIWGWVLVSCFSVAIALCMAELVSAFPTSGGMYYWSFMLAPRKHRLLACWLTGWMNLLGQVANTASLELGLTKFVVNTLVKLHTVGPGEQPGYQATPSQAMAVLAALLILHAALNSMGHGVTRVMLVFSGLWNVVATLGFCAMLVGVAPTHQTASFALTKWRSGSEASGISSSLYICVVGLLMSQWSIMGYDACVHLAEETVDVGTSVSRGLVLAVAGSCGMGLCTLLCLNFSMQSLDNLVNEDSVTTGMAQLTWDVFRARYGYGHGSIASMSSIALVAMFMSCLTAITANSRMVYAFSRDGAMLGSRWWRQLSARGQQPVAGAWLMALLSFLLGLPGVFMPQYLKALSAACVVALTLSYGTPIALSILTLV
ncbi:uncharacterized protein HaLaN_11520 [Haematococcus lacustris]|uniref:Uncharacterized protein n=1 Tax=Haematococcus lacustris TaxID=44745 RepID=A0A699Z7R3_HAELA|nr:uncharacterized protein HaLaN_11520 [Haematococcus lacustris]